MEVGGLFFLFRHLFRIGENISLWGSYLVDNHRVLRVLRTVRDLKWDLGGHWSRLVLAWPLAGRGFRDG